MGATVRAIAAHSAPTDPWSPRDVVCGSLNFTRSAARVQVLHRPALPGGDDHPEEGGRQLLQLSARETSVPENPLVLGERVSITPRRAGEHDQAERGSGGRRDAVLLRDELQGDGPAARL